MNMIEWNEKLSIGNYAIDEQHKELINLINDVAKLIKWEYYEVSDVFYVVTKLDNYIIEHFNYEEMLMDKSSFPEKEEHIKQHDLARKKIGEINVFEQENFEEKFLNDILEWLISWLLNHIMSMDKKLELYI